MKTEETCSVSNSCSTRSKWIAVLLGAGVFSCPVRSVESPRISSLAETQGKRKQTASSTAEIR